MNQSIFTENQGERLSALVDETKRRSRPWSDDTARMLGAVLCAAAILKGVAAFHSPGEGLDTILPVVGAAVEVVIGVALLLRVRPSISVPAASLFFALMAGAAWVGTVGGAASCGCFGSLEVPPRVMLVFDAGAAAALLWGMRRSGAMRQQQTVNLLAACIASFLISIVVGSTLHLKLRSQPTLQSPNGMNLEQSVLRLGEPFILLPYIQIDADLSQGEWKIIFANSECRTCKQVLRGGGCKPEGQERVAVILVNRDEGWTLYKECQAVLGRLVPGKNWNISTPRTIWLKDGRLSRIG